MLERSPPQQPAWCQQIPWLLGLLLVVWGPPASAKKTSTRKTSPQKSRKRSPRRAPKIKVPDPPKIYMKDVRKLPLWNAPSTYQWPRKKQNKRKTQHHRRGRLLRMREITGIRHKGVPQRQKPRSGARVPHASIPTPKTPGFRLRIFRTGFYRQAWVRQMWGEIWLLRKRQKPRILGLSAAQRHRLRKLWRHAQDKLSLPPRGPYSRLHARRLKRFLQQHQYVEVILQPFGRKKTRSTR